MKAKLFWFGKFIRVIDDQNVISLTNLGMWACILKLATSVQPSYAEVGSLLVALAAYNIKRVVDRKQKDKTEQETIENQELKNKVANLEEALKATQDKIGAVSLAVGFKKGL